MVPWTAVNEMHRPVMRAAVIHALQDAVRVRRKPAIGEEHRLDPLAQLLIRQEKQAFAARALSHCHLRLAVEFTSALLTFQVTTRTNPPISRKNYVRCGPFRRNIRKPGG